MTTPLKPPFHTIAIFAERRKTRQFVGKLSYLQAEDMFEFTYDDDYLYAKRVIPVGPELPLTQRSFRSKILFPSLQDRIPSKQNAAYPEYCEAMGVSTDETNLIMLLGTIGKRGPSCFVFEPVYDDVFSAENLRNFRKELGLTTREFSLCFNVPRVSLLHIENGESPGKEILRRIELYCRFPEVAIFEIQRNGGAIHPDRKLHALKILKGKGNYSELPNSSN